MLFDVQRLGPIITPESSPTIGTNINGPALLQAPAWLENAPGKYLLYFAHHKGENIRLAYADQLAGPWKVYEPGTLKLSQTVCMEHVASPDVHIDPENRKIRMYFHGPVGELSNQVTFSALSADGINFDVLPEKLGPSYFRVFLWQGSYYAFSRTGTLHRGLDPDKPFTAGHNPFSSLSQGTILRHCAVHIQAHRLLVFYSNIGDDPESILCSTIDLRSPWQHWQASKPQLVLRPQTNYEGANLPPAASREGAAREPLNQLRDPAIFEEQGQLYLLYSIAGESGIALVKLTPKNPPFVFSTLKRLFRPA